VIATLNLNGDYISDALAAQVGGIGIAPGANLSNTTAVFEATHGTAPKYAKKTLKSVFFFVFLLNFYKESISASPNSEQDNKVAPSINLSKS
jgi:hypothetical protein